MLPSPIKTSKTLILFAVLMFALAACSSDKASGEEGDFVLNMYVGAEEIGGQSVEFTDPQSFTNRERYRPIRDPQHRVLVID